MADQTADAVQPEEISNSFRCSICLDLLYKPIVLPCGHIGCFWCVHRSMNYRGMSHCQICLCPFNHLSNICEMLHFLLLKIYPVACKKRESQMRGEEEKIQSQSPQFDDHTYPTIADGGFDHLVDYACSSDTVVTRTDGKNQSGIDLVAGKEKKQALLAYLSCAASRHLLFQPVVLNCGHAFCESCIICSDDERITCKVCEMPHPARFPKVCLALDYFLEENFPKEYRLRRDAVQLDQALFKHQSAASHYTYSDEENALFFNVLSLSTNGIRIHVGVGCDSCGKSPIVGDRYRCRDCTEAMGFDLCSNCYNSPSKLPGRFNQQHTPEHRFQIISNDQG
ncbi:hypothetical protein SLA2020_001270 [Shorea laevis]